MGLLKKIGAAIRGGQHETMQAVVDSQAIRVLEQEIRDCRSSVAAAKVEMTKVVAERKACDRELEQLETLQAKLEAQAVESLAVGDELNAQHRALQLADAEQAYKEQSEHQRVMQSLEDGLRENLQKADRRINQHVRELRLAKSSDSAYRSNSHGQLYSSNLASQLQEVQDSLSRIKQRQQTAEDLTAASRQVEQMFGTDTEEPIDFRAQAILQELRSQSSA